MSSEVSEAVVGFSFPTRCCVAVESPDNPLFLVASCLVRDENELYLVQYDPVGNSAQIKKVYPHPFEVRYMSILSSDTSHIFTSSPATDSRPAQTCLYELNENSSSGRVGELTQKFSFPVSVPSKVVPSPDDQNSVALLNSQGLSFWSNTGSEYKQTSEVTYPWTQTQSPLAIAWDSLHTEYIATANGGDIHILDRRENKKALTIDAAHFGNIRSLNFSPIVQYRLVSGSEDGSIALWDTRNLAGKELLSFDAHTHWVENVSFNPFHTDLLLSCSTDGSAKIWDISSATPTPSLTSASSSLSSSSSSSSASMPYCSALSSSIVGSFSVKKTEQPQPAVLFNKHEGAISSSVWCLSPNHPWHALMLYRTGIASVGTVPSQLQMSLLLKPTSF